LASCSKFIIQTQVSKNIQNLNAQLDALAKVDAERPLSETVSDAKTKRPELEDMLDQLHDDDIVVVTMHDIRINGPTIGL
jgi:DNA invertase Pin-like site-specific DNA recombinase